MARPIPKSYYYSGQGRLGIGDRDPATGKSSNVIFVGNVTSLTVDISQDKFEHKESMSGSRGLDLTFSKENKATFKFVAESLVKSLLALGLYGQVSEKVAGTVTAEKHTVKPGMAIPLANPNVDAVVVKTTAATPVTLVENTDYIVDEGFGTVHILPTTLVVLPAGTEVSVDYTFEKFSQIDSFTNSVAPERYLRFEGLNTVDGSLRLIEIPRASFDPITGLEFINDELGSGEFNGSALLDSFITTVGDSQFFRERRIGTDQ